MRQPNRSKAALLGFLTWGPMSGYDLRRVIERSIANFWTESYGRIYPMLAELTKEGLVECDRTKTDGGRQRNVYTLTKQGRAVLDEWLALPSSAAPPRDERLLKLFFGARTSDEASRELVKRFRAEVEENQARYDATRESIESAKDAHEDQRFWLMTLRYGELKAQMEIAWCDEMLQQLGSGD